MGFDRKRLLIHKGRFLFKKVLSFRLENKAKKQRVIIMFLVSLLLIGLIAATLIAEQESAVAEQEELIAIPVKAENK